MINIFAVYLLFFSDYKIGILSISDWALMFFLFKSFLYKPTISVRKQEALPMCLIIIGVLMSYIFNCYNTWFSDMDYLQTFVKFSVYLLALQMVPGYLQIQKIDYLKHIDIFLKLSVLGAVIQRVIVIFLGRSSWPLYSLGGNWFGLTTETTMFTNEGMMRARSFWSEPAHFAVFISLLFIMLLYTGNERLNNLTWIAYIAGIILANSFAGYGIAIAIISIYFLKIHTYADVSKLIVYGGIIIVVFCCIWNTNDYLRSRIINLFQLKDHSGVVRTLGGFQFLKYIPWYGVGLGNHANYYNSLNLLSTLWFSGSGEFYNNILLAIITMGYIGTIGFLMLQYNILKDKKKLFIVLMITHFGWGKLYTTPIWIFLILYIVIKSNTVMEVR